MPLRKLILLFLLLPFFGVAQTVIPTGAVNQLTYQRGGYGADSVLAIPVKDTIYNGFPSYRLRGRLTLRPQDSVIYYHTGSYWKAVGTGSGGGGTYTDGFGLDLSGSRFDVDTATIAQVYLLDYKVDVSDTTNWINSISVNPTMIKQGTAKDPIFGVDTAVIATQYDINSKVNYSDTTNWVNGVLGSNTIVINNTAKFPRVNADTSYLATKYDNSLKLNISDTSAMLTPYVNFGDTATIIATQHDISGFIPYTDTSNKIETRYHANATYLKITDTTGKWVYQVDDGYGINIGGTTKQPLVSVDTNEITTPYDIRKLTNAVIADTVNNVQAVSGIIRFTRTAGTNTISLLNDSDHKPINVDSIWISGNDIIIRFKETCTQIYDFVIGNDESTQGIHTGQGSINNITGAYTMGASVALNVATIRVSKPAKLTAAFTYNGTSWNVAAQPSTSPFSWTSPALTVTYSSGRVRINTASSFEVTGSPIAICQPANGDANLMYDVACEYLSTTQSDFYFHNAMGKLTASTPPTNLSFVVDFGVATVRVNPTTEDFGSAGNFWFTGKVKIIK